MTQSTTLLSEDLGNGIFRESLSNGQIVAYRLTSVSHEAINTWIAAQTRLMEAWPADRPICILADQSSLEFLTFTPTMKSRFAELAAASEGKSGRVAIVVGKGFHMQMATGFFKNADTRGMSLSFFLDRDQAMAWLMEIALPEYSTNKA